MNKEQRDAYLVDLRKIFDLSIIIISVLFMLMTTIGENTGTLFALAIIFSITNMYVRLHLVASESPHALFAPTARVISILSLGAFSLALLLVG